MAKIDLPGATAGQVIGQDPPANAVDVAAPKVNLLVAQEASPDNYANARFRWPVVGVGDARYQRGRVFTREGDHRPTCHSSFDREFSPSKSSRFKSDSIRLGHIAASEITSEHAGSSAFSCCDHRVSRSCAGAQSRRRFRNPFCCQVIPPTDNWRMPTGARTLRAGDPLRLLWRAMVHCIKHEFDAV